MITFLFYFDFYLLSFYFLFNFNYTLNFKSNFNLISIWIPLLFGIRLDFNSISIVLALYLDYNSSLTKFEINFIYFPIQFQMVVEFKGMYYWIGV